MHAIGYVGQCDVNMQAYRPARAARRPLLMTTVTRMWTLNPSINNSVLIRRHRHNNSSASAPLTATNIALTNGSDVEVVRVGPKLSVSICNVVFARSRDAERIRAELTLAQHGSVSGLFHIHTGPEVALPSEHPRVLWRYFHSTTSCNRVAALGRDTFTL